MSHGDITATATATSVGRRVSTLFFARSASGSGIVGSSRTSQQSPPSRPKKKAQHMEAVAEEEENDQLWSLARSEYVRTRRASLKGSSKKLRPSLSAALDNINHAASGDDNSHVVDERLTMGGMVMAHAELNQAREEHAAWFLLPPDSLAVSVWEIFTAAVLVFVAVFTPYEVAFLPPPTFADDWLFVLGRLIDLIFVFDMGAQFVLMVPRVGEPGKLETRPRVIAAGYLRGWFSLDLVAVASSIFDIVPVAVGSQEGARSLTLFRVIRVLRLIKMVRLVRASRLIKQWSVKVSTPRATLTLGACLVECAYVVHFGACILGLLTVFEDSPLDTWYATHGYCTDVSLYGGSGGTGSGGGGGGGGTGGGSRDEYECTGAGQLYFACFWWSAGMLMGAPISLTANAGPYERIYTSGQLLTLNEQAVVLALKAATAFLWTTVIARFVTVYNNLDPDARDFRFGWDALNRFVSYFRIPKADALELRRYYIERAESARAKSRKRVMNDFSPMLAEKCMWKLNKEWLCRVPCFSLVVDRLLARPNSGMERFLVKVALKMTPEIYVPTERPPPFRLYIITNGVAIHRGKRCRTSDSWGAEDVLLLGRPERRRYKAIAITYLHVLWVGKDMFEEIHDIGGPFHEAFMLTKLWAMIYATGEEMLERNRRENKIKAIKVGSGAGDFAPPVIEARINAGTTQVIARRHPDGTRVTNGRGQDLYDFRFPSLVLSEHEIVKERSGPAGQFVYRILPCEATAASTGDLGGAAVAPSGESGGKHDGGANGSKDRSSSSGSDTAAELAQQLSSLTATFQAQSEATGKQLAGLAAAVAALSASRGSVALAADAKSKNLGQYEA